MFEFNEKQLWKDRIGQTAKEYIQYLKYIFNGHLLLVFVFLLGTAAYYYQAWLKRLPEHFPAGIIMSILLALLVTKSPVYTLLKDADKIFLIPVEVRMARYFIKCMMISFIVQAYFLIIGLGVLMPMYAQMNNQNFRLFWYFLVVLFVSKGLNMFIRWHVQYFINTNYHYIDSIIRYCINMILLYFLFSNSNPIFVVMTLLMLILLLLYFHHATKWKGVNWEYLIGQDEKRLSSFYLFANMFTDVPKLKNRIKRRKLFDLFVKRIRFDGNKAFIHLFWRTYFRSGDYFGLTVRLTIIGGGTLYFLSFGLGQVLLALLFLFLTGLQLIPLWNAYQDKLWVDLYPLAGALKTKSFKSLISTVLLLQSILLSLIIFLKGDLAISLFSIVGSFLFIYLFVRFYLNRKRLS
ncbi:ABC transporter permease [Niallia sp. 03133]|uniref:ABC transporter permease n=1 Tax=Niallia sp. 03133 TaxID=3458060 RepID=UPI004043DCF1